MTDKAVAQERTVWEVYEYDTTQTPSGGWVIIARRLINPSLELTLRVRSGLLGNPWDPVRDEYRRCQIGVPAIKAALRRQGHLLELDGDSVHITVASYGDGRPLGELRCLSHTSLDPVRPRE